MTKQTAIVTKASLQALLDDPAKRADVIGRALVVLFERQLDDEKAANATRTTNNQGFAQSDAKAGCIAAKTYLKRAAMRRRGELPEGQEVLPEFVIQTWMAPQRGAPRISKYTRQLNEAAMKKKLSQAQG